MAGDAAEAAAVPQEAAGIIGIAAGTTGTAAGITGVTAGITGAEADAEAAVTAAADADAAKDPIQEIAAAITTGWAAYVKYLSARLFASHVLLYKKYSAAFSLLNPYAII